MTEDTKPSTPLQEWHLALDALTNAVVEEEETEAKIDTRAQDIRSQTTRFKATKMRINLSTEEQIQSIENRVQVGNKILQAAEKVANNYRSITAQIREKLDAVNELYLSPGKVLPPHRAKRTLPVIKAYKFLKRIQDKLEENENVTLDCNKRLFTFAVHLASLKLLQAQTSSSADRANIAKQEKEFTDIWRKAGEVYFSNPTGKESKGVIDGRIQNIEVATNIRYERMKSLLSRSNELGNNFAERSTLLHNAIEEADALVEHYGHLVLANGASTEFKQLKKYFELRAIGIAVNAFQIDELHVAQKAESSELEEPLKLLMERTAVIDATIERFKLWENLESPDAFMKLGMSELQLAGYGQLNEDCKNLPLLYKELHAQSDVPAVKELMQRTIDSAESLNERAIAVLTRLSAEQKLLQAEDNQSPTAAEEQSPTDQRSDQSEESYSDYSISPSTDEGKESETVWEGKSQEQEIAELEERIANVASDLEKEKQTMDRLKGQHTADKLPLMEEECFGRIAQHEQELEQHCANIASRYFNLASDEESLPTHGKHVQNAQLYLGREKDHAINAQNAISSALRLRCRRFRAAPDEDFLLGVKDNEVKQFITIKLPYAPEALDQNGDFLRNKKTNQFIYDHVVEHQLLIKGDIEGDLQCVVHEHFYVESKQEGITAEMLLNGECGRRVAVVIKKWDEKGKGRRYIERFKKRFGIIGNMHPNGKELKIYHSPVSKMCLQRLYDWKKNALKKAGPAR